MMCIEFIGWTKKNHKILKNQFKWQFQLTFPSPPPLLFSRSAYLMILMQTHDEQKEYNIEKHSIVI